MPNLRAHVACQWSGLFWVQCQVLTLARMHAAFPLESYIFSFKKTKKCLSLLPIESIFPPYAEINYFFTTFNSHENGNALNCRKEIECGKLILLHECFGKTLLHKCGLRTPWPCLWDPYCFENFQR